MRLFFNQKQIPSAADIFFNGQPVKRVFFNRVKVWLRAVLLKNPVGPAAELNMTWSDKGYDVKIAVLYQGVPERGHIYYVRTNYGCWGVGYDNGPFTAHLKIWLGDQLLAEKRGNGHVDGTVTAVHTLLTGDGTEVILSAEGVRDNSAQGSMGTAETMVVDVTRLTEEGFTTPEAIWQKIGFFRGEKQIEF